jgi:excisionase family DNA binding protein
VSLESQLDELIAEVRKINEKLPAALNGKGAEWVSIQETAARLSISPDTVRRKIVSRELPAKRIGKSWRVDITAILARES